MAMTTSGGSADCVSQRRQVAEIDFAEGLAQRSKNRRRFGRAESEHTAERGNDRDDEAGRDEQNYPGGTHIQFSR